MSAQRPSPELGRPGCASCVDSDGPDWHPSWEGVGCLDGQVYGYCVVPECGGLCEPQGRCDCTCHSEQSDEAQTPECSATEVAQ